MLATFYLELVFTILLGEKVFYCSCYEDELYTSTECQQCFTKIKVDTDFWENDEHNFICYDLYNCLW